MKAPTYLYKGYLIVPNAYAGYDGVYQPKGHKLVTLSTDPKGWIDLIQQYFNDRYTTTIR